MQHIRMKDLGIDGVVVVIFMASLLFFIAQHMSGLGWDFSAYVLNAKYLIGESQYFEWMRPPLTSFTLLLFSAFDWPLAEYAFIIFVSALFMGACLEFSKAFGLNRRIFYALMLAPIVLSVGFSDGSELLTLSLLMLAVSSLHTYGGEKKALLFGLFLALAFLCRYETIVFFPILFIQRPTKGVVKELLISILVIALVVSPWLAYNHIASGNWLTSIEDLYAINIKFRDYISTPPNPLHIIAASAYYLPLFLLGMIKRHKKFGYADAVMAFVFTVVIAAYILKPTKTPRYLLSMVLPLSYFSAYFIQSHLKLHMRKIEGKLAMMILALNILLALPFMQLTEQSVYRSVVANIEQCRMDSNGWVFLNYYGVLSEPHPWNVNVGKELEEGKRILLFKHIWEPDYSRDEGFLSQFPIIEDNENYVLLGNTSVCLLPEPYTKTYLQNYAENNNLSMTSCEVLLSEELCKKYGFLETLI